MGVETIRSVAGVIAAGCGTMSFVGSPCPACRLVRGGVTKRKTRLSWNTQPTVISILVDRAPTSVAARLSVYLRESGHVAHHRAPSACS